MNISYGFYNSPFGQCCLAFSEDGISVLVFAENEEQAIAELHHRLPEQNFVVDTNQAKILGDKIFLFKAIIKINPKGTPFQQSVWKALLEIPAGATSTYAQIATAIGRPKAVRAVGTAIGANPIAYIIPCHRVIHSDANLGGYRWGLERKVQMLNAESLTSNCYINRLD
ncbi:MAG: methylated-DNA--[protein]-cysteine S-methyltransferase [Paludibacter sp.]|nr:methylated-DNA--[protein]-cysteine S-methyltransferase [Paludibacter sp.]